MTMPIDPAQEEAFRKRIGDEPADAKGHDRYPGDSKDDVADRQEHDPEVPTPGDDDGPKDEPIKDDDELGS